MTKKHDEIFDAVLSGIGPDTRGEKKDRGAGRFLKRGNAIGEKLNGERDEKTMMWVDPARCRMWDRHNRNYGLLNEDNCADLIEGIQQQGQQEFPAIVRRVTGEDGIDFEVICGARRHFAVSWLRANNFPQFKYLVEERNLSDEEAFRLADVENRDRSDISDYERACDYANAIKLYYDGKQKTMAERLKVSEGWLSRYLYLSKLPTQIVEAFPTPNDLKELHARALKPVLLKPKSRDSVIERAEWLRDMRAATGMKPGEPWSDATKVLAELKRAGQGAPAKRKGVAKPTQVYRQGKSEYGIVRTDKGRSITLELKKDMPHDQLQAMLNKFILDRSEDC